MKPLYGFMQDGRFYEDVAHVLIGLVPGWGWWREHRQWPPGDVWIVMQWLPRDSTGEWQEGGPHGVTQLGRVADAYRDFLGYAIGGVLRTISLIGLLIWKF